MLTILLTYVDIDIYILTLTLNRDIRRELNEFKDIIARNRTESDIFALKCMNFCSVFSIIDFLLWN